MHILTPARAIFKEDLAIRAKLLKESVKDKFPIGFEVILLNGPEGDFACQEIIRRNLDPFLAKPDFYIALHAPYKGNNYSKGLTDLTSEKGLETLAKVLQFAGKINAQIVNLHADNIRLRYSLLQNNKFYQEKQKLQEKMKQGILQVKKSIGYNGLVAVENMPYLLIKNGKITSLKNAICDPIINTANDLSFFANTPGIGVCLDTCHYGITKKIISKIADQENKKQPSLVELANKLKSSLKSVHLSDYKGDFISEKASFEEGQVLGEGQYQSELKPFIKLIAEKQIPVTLEIRDKDIKNPAESKKSINYLLKILET